MTTDMDNVKLIYHYYYYYYFGWGNVATQAIAYIVIRITFLNTIVQFIIHEME